MRGGSQLIVSDAPLPVRVECYAGYRGEESPRRFRLLDSWLAVEVLDVWLAPDHRYFKVRGSDGDTYLLRNDTESQRWELVQYLRSPHGSSSSRASATLFQRRASSTVSWSTRTIGQSSRRPPGGATSARRSPLIQWPT